MRFQGGHNAGHTLVVGDTTYKLSLLPSGIVTGTLSIVGNGVVLDPWHLKAEVEKLEGQGVEINPDNSFLFHRLDAGSRILENPEDHEFTGRKLPNR